MRGVCCSRMVTGLLGMGLVLHIYGAEKAYENPVVRPVQRPTYECRYVEKPPIIDGTGKSAVWKNIPEVQCVAPWTDNKDQLALEATHVKVCWDDNNVYFLAVLEDKNLRGSGSTAAARKARTQGIPNKELALGDKTSICNDERVELYLTPDPETGSFIGLEFTTRDLMLDYMGGYPHQWDPKWNSEGITHKATLQGTLDDDKPDTSYTVEAAIPWKNYESICKKTQESGKISDKTVPPKPGDAWRVCFSREDQAMENGIMKRGHSLWCDPGTERPEFLHPNAFGTIVFAK